MKSEFENIINQKIAQLDKQQAEIELEKKKLKNALAAYLRKEEDKIDILPRPKKNKSIGEKGKSAVKQAAILALFSEGETLSNKAAAERAKMNGIDSSISNVTSALNTLKKKGILEGVDRGLFRRPFSSEQVVDIKE